MEDSSGFSVSVDSHAETLASNYEPVPDSRERNNTEANNTTMTASAKTKSEKNDPPSDGPAAAVDTPSPGHAEVFEDVEEPPARPARVVQLKSRRHVTYQ